MARAELEQRFDALLAVHGRSLARLAASYARGGSERDDLFQEIALAIWRALPGFRGECSERTFVFRIAHNRGISDLARRRTPAAGAAWALVSGDPDIVVVAVATWVFIAITWAVSLTIEGGLGQWKPASATTAAFVAFSIGRRVATRRAIVAFAVLYAAFAVFMFAWRFQNPDGDAPTDVWSYLAARWIFWTITAILTVVGAWRWRALGRELEVLREFRHRA